jgi:hypothetical protein
MLEPTTRWALIRKIVKEVITLVILQQEPEM